MGTVTSAWATSTDNLPTGYYKIKSAVTGNSNITNIHMFNDAFLEVNTPKATLLSAETAETNNYIWYVTNTGGSKISIVNGQGTGIKLEDGNKGSYSYKGPHKELTPVDANSTYPTSIYFSEGLYTPNTSVLNLLTINMVVIQQQHTGQLQIRQQQNGASRALV